MKTAFVRKIATAPYKQFFNSGWETIEGIDCFIGMGHLQEIDGQYDVCIVGPGGFHYDQDLYRKRSDKTKFIYINEEDMHHSVEALRCIADYYDYLCVFSEINFLALRSLGVKNVLEIFPAVDLRYYHPLSTEKKFDVTFLGQQDFRIRIGEATRVDYLQNLESKRDTIDPFIGRGFYCEDANLIYNQSKLALDLPVSFAIGPRSFQIAATTSALMLPAGIRSRKWLDTFIPKEDYFEFTPTISGFQEATRTYINNEEARKIVSENMRRKILSGHTFNHRFNQIIDAICGGFNGLDR